MDYTARQLQAIWNAGCRIEAIKLLRAQCDARLKQAKDAFEDNTVEAVMQICAETNKRRRVEGAAFDMMFALRAARAVLLQKSHLAESEWSRCSIAKQIDAALAKAGG